MTSSVRQHRLFYALWPDPPTRAALAHIQAGLAGAITRPEKLHLTMAFLGQQPASALPALCHILHSVAAQPIELALDATGFFSGQRIAWAGMQVTAPGLLDLRGALMDLLAGQQFVPVFEHDRFTPHITLARKASPPPDGGRTPIHWLARELVLVESSSTNGDYRIIASRLLHGDAKEPGAHGHT